MSSLVGGSYLAGRVKEAKHVVSLQNVTRTPWEFWSNCKVNCRFVVFVQSSGLGLGVPEADGKLSKEHDRLGAAGEAHVFGLARTA
jgi:hypothetical protein